MTHMMDTPHPIDLQVGRALRRERKAAGWSQQRLAEALGVSFQQLQKYERGSNRISASKLFEATRALGLKPSSLFGDGAPTEPATLSDEELRQLTAALRKLPAGHRRAVMALIEALQAAEAPRAGELAQLSAPSADRAAHPL